MMFGGHLHYTLILTLTGLFLFAEINSAIFDVRLVGGPSTSDGRVEFLHGGIWLPICGSKINLPAAEVICRSLGYKYPTEYSGSSKYGKVSNTGLLYFECFGSESHLSECSPDFAPFGICEGKLSGQPTASVACSGEAIKARLVGGQILPTQAEGKVELYINGAWHPVIELPETWHNSDASVACYMMGYVAGQVMDTDLGDVPAYTQVMDSVECTGDEEDLLECPHQWRSFGKAHPAAVVYCRKECSATWCGRGCTIPCPCLSTCDSFTCECDPSCPDLRDKVSMNVQFNPLPFPILPGTTSELTCESGYVSTETSLISLTVQCSNQHTWEPSPSNLRCVAVNCGTPPSLSHGMWFIKAEPHGQYRYLSEYDLQCDDGYLPEKSDIRVLCEETGLWGVQPQGSVWGCHVALSAPNVVLHGTSVMSLVFKQGAAQGVINPPDQFVIQYKASGQSHWTDGPVVIYQGYGENSQVLLSGLSPATRYMIQVVPESGGQRGTPSQATVAETAPESPPAVTTTTTSSNMSANQETGPRIDSIYPNKGPRRGGTKLTITGAKLGELDVYIGLVQCEIESRSESLLVCITGESSLGDENIRLVTPSGGDLEVPGHVSPLFSYKENAYANSLWPDVSILSGGIDITVTGLHLDSVASPSMIYSVKCQQQNILQTEECVVKTAEEMHCKVPTNLKEILDSKCEKIPFESNIYEPMRGDRVTDPYSASIIMDINIDGDRGVMTLIQSVPLILYADPVIHSQKRIVVDKQPDTNIWIQGQHLYLGPSSNQLYKVSLGDGMCRVNANSHTQIGCMPPNAEPSTLEKEDQLLLKVKVGTLDFVVGPVKYGKIWWDEPLYRYTTIGGVILVFLVLIILVIVWCKVCRRGSKNRRSEGSKMDPNHYQTPIMPPRPVDPNHYQTPIMPPRPVGRNDMVSQTNPVYEHVI